MSKTPPRYLICTHPRSGSTYLCQLLESTGKLGRPRDYFNAGPVGSIPDPETPQDPAEQYRHYLATAATDNGVLGAKMFWFDFARLAKAGLAQHVREHRIVILERADKLAQAISSSRALRSGKMWASAAASDEHVEYDYAHIRVRLAGVLRADAVWRQFAAENGEPALRLVYEDVVDDPQAAVDRIARHIGIAQPVPIDRDHVEVRVQRDARSAEWHARFLAEARESDPELLRALASARSA